MTMQKGILFVLVGLAIMLPGLNGSPTREPDTLWQTDGSVTELAFLPESTLNRLTTTELKSLPLPSRSADLITHRIQRSRERAAKGQTKCDSGVMGALPAGVGQEAPEGIEALDVAGVVVRGTVERLVHGLFADSEPGTLTAFRVTTVLKGGSIVHVGDRLTILESIGKTTVQGSVICVEKPGYRLPKEGEDILVAGERDPVNPGHLLSDERLVFFIQNGIVNDGAEGQTHWQMSFDDLKQILVGRSS